MLFAFAPASRGLARLGHDAPLSAAIWIDLYRPLDSQVAAAGALVPEIPSLAEMEEIEISNRLYREDGTDYMTVVLPGLSTTKTPMAGPVTFILAPGRLVTVRHHAPRPFETFPERAEKSISGCSTPERVLLGLFEEIISRLADLLEGAGKALDGVSAGVFGGAAAQRPGLLQASLEQVGQQGELLGRVRLALLTLGRALSFFSQGLDAKKETGSLRPIVKGHLRDIQALEVHADFLENRISLAVDATLGMINLSQNNTTRILSVVAALFLPPTLIASIYGMNFAVMPELSRSWGYPFALGLMLASALLTYLVFKWKKWL